MRCLPAVALTALLALSCCFFCCVGLLVSPPNSRAAWASRPVSSRSSSSSSSSNSISSSSRQRRRHTGDSTVTGAALGGDQHADDPESRAWAWPLVTGGKLLGAATMASMLLVGHMTFLPPAVAKSPDPSVMNMLDEVELLERKTEEMSDLKSEKVRASKRTKKSGSLPFVQIKKDLRLRTVNDANLQTAIDKIQALAPYLDETEYLVSARNWGYLQGFLGVFSEREENFVDLIDGLYPTENAIDTSAREAMQFEAQQIFLALDDLYQAAKTQKVQGAQKAYVKLALSYDRFTKAGGLYFDDPPAQSDSSDFFVDSKEELEYDKDTPPVVQDMVVLLKGPDRGKKGKLIGVINARGEGIVRLESSGRKREVVLVGLKDIGKQSSPKAATKAAKSQQSQTPVAAAAL